MWRKISIFLFGLCCLSFVFIGADAVKPWKDVTPAEKAELSGYLKPHGMSPEDYVISKLRAYDVVFIGEYHRIKHDVELIHRLIPRLYQAGIYNLGIEFGCFEFQDQVDRLITAPEYDADLARQLMFQWDSSWGYIEYMDIYRKAWELNRSLPQGKPKFRVVGLNYKPDWAAMQEKMTPELWKKVWHKGDPDECMANVVLKEFVDKNLKALIYSGSHHAFTRYHQPVVDFEKKTVIRMNSKRMGNLVLEKIPDKVFNIFLHSPWSTKASFEQHNYPVAGVIDRVMGDFEAKRIGFDVSGSPFGEIRDPDTYYAYGYDAFTLGDFCDGYIFQKHFKDYEGCTADDQFITEKNLKEAILAIPNFAFRKFVKAPRDLLDAIKSDADMKRRFEDLQ